MRKVDNPDDQGGIVPPPNPTPYPQPEPYNQPTNVGNAWGATDSIIGRVLHYITSPWRFAVVVILALLSWVLFVSYQNIDYIKNVMQRRLAEPHMNLSLVDNTIAIMMKSTGANSTLLYKIDPALNKKEILRAYDSSGRDKNVEGEQIGLFSTNKNNNQIVTQMMTNQIVCLQETEPTNSASLWFESKGANYICMMSLPVDTFQFTGQLTVGFDKQPDNIERVKDIMVITGSQIMQE